MLIKLKNNIMIYITLSKIMLWTTGILLFIISVLGMCGINKFHIILFNGKDNGLIILVTIFSFTFITTFVQKKWEMFILGIININLSLIGIIGVLITSFISIITWLVLIIEIISIISSIIWILTSCNIIKNKI